MSILFKNCSILLADSGRMTCLRHGYLGVDGLVIDYIGAERPHKQYTQEKDYKNHLLMPGLVNGHCHAGMVLMRGLGSGLPLHDWLHLLWPIEGQMTEMDIQTGVELAMLEMIASGITSYTDMYFHPPITIEAASRSGMKVNLGYVVQCFDETLAYKDYARAKESLDLFRTYHGAYQDRIHVDFAIHAEYTCTPEIVGGYSEACRGLGGRMHLHLSETKAEHDDCVKKYGKTPAQWFYDLGTFDTKTCAAHCVWVTDEDLELLKEKNVTVIHNPSSNMKLGSGFAPIPKMIQMGIPVALGTDGAASNNNLNMFEEMHFASVIHSGYHHNAALISTDTVLDMATRQGALMQGRPDTGILSVGNKADIIAIDLDKPHLQPQLDLPSLLVYSAQSSDVSMTMVDGTILYENGVYFTLDKERIFHSLRSSTNRLYPQLDM